ncbi:MAG: response regulator transcription factor [Acidobacteria bacterium]|nr:response regulator transcription factor [Acidobacteriota bacterium]
MTSEVRILIADDHPIIRDYLRKAFAEEAHLKVVAEAGDAETTLKLIRELQPEVAILDIRMPKTNGFGEPQPVAFALMRTIQREQLPVKVILLTGHHHGKDSFDAAMKLGVNGYVLKASATAEIVASVKAVVEGRHYISPLLSSYLVQHHENEDAFVKRYPGLKELTPKERWVLKLVAENKSSHEIAGALNITSQTVNNHRTHVCDKLGLKGPNALLKFALAYHAEIIRFCQNQLHYDA